MKMAYMNSVKLWVIPFIALASLASCDRDYMPKPRGFQRIDLPNHSYQPFTAECGFECEIPTYANAIPDNHPTAEKCWYNVEFKDLNATLHLSYKPFKTPLELVDLTEDARTLVYKHTIKADEIYETQISNAHLSGMLYELSGNTATNFQFYITDNKSHYIRGSLYFNAKTNLDSIAPVLAFLKTDIIHSIETIRWR